jgi:hypothetical protein
MRSAHGVVNLKRISESGPAEECDAARIGCVSMTHSGLSDVQPGGVCLGAELSVGGGGQSVSTRAEVVGDGAERNQKALRVSLT